MGFRKGFLVAHSKSSAAVVSIAIHAILILLALSYVTVTVVMKDKVAFQARSVNRPSMHLTKLHVPVKINKTHAPKLRKRIVVPPKIKRMMPAIKMPEVVGIRGGLGGMSGSGIGNLGGPLGFSMPEINLFGVKGKAQRIMLILDGSQEMAADALGGTSGFEIIKKECLKRIEGLPPTAVFNMVVYGTYGGDTRELFPHMVSATPGNVQKAKAWLMPLNEFKGTDTRYGISTLGPGGTAPRGKYAFGKFKEDRIALKYWNESVMLAMQQQADMVFLLTGQWGYFGYDVAMNDEVRTKWNQTSEGKRWAAEVKKCRRLLDEDNARRKAAGQPPRALNRNNELHVVRAYAPGFSAVPPHGKRIHLSVVDLAKAFHEAYQAYAGESRPMGGLKKNSHPRFSLNIIYFKPAKFKNDKAEGISEQGETNFKQLAESLRGEVRSIEGLTAIQSYVTAASSYEN